MDDGDLIILVVSILVGMALFYRITYLAVKHAIEDAKVLRYIRDAVKPANRQPPSGAGDAGTSAERDGSKRE